MRGRLSGLAILLMAAPLAGSAYLVIRGSSEIVSPPRPRISESARAVVGVELRDDPDGAVVVERAVPPASTAGLRPGDRIVRLDGAPVLSAEAVARAVRREPAGHTFRFEARRAGGQVGILVEVSSKSRPVSPADLGLPFEEVSLASRSGLLLRGWYVPPPEAGSGRAPAIAYGHGNGADRRSWLRAAPEVHEAGLAQLLLDFSGRGESEGEVVTLGANESLDLRSALDWLERRPEVDPDRLALAGHSMGAVAAILAAAEDPRARALVLDSPFADLARLVDETIAARYHVPPALLRGPVLALAGWRAGYDPYRLRPVEAIPRVRVPILLFHGDRDEEVGIHHGEALRDAAGGPVTWVVLEGLGHNSRRPAAYSRKVACFLADTLGADRHACAAGAERPQATVGRRGSP